MLTAFTKTTARNHATVLNSHPGATLFSDHSSTNDFNSAAANEFAVRCTGAARFVTAIDGSGNPTQTLALASNGNLGVGTASPAATLEVNGSVLISHDGRFQAKDTGGTPRNIMFIGGDNNIYMVNDISGSLYVIQVAATSRAQFGNPLWLSARGTYTDFFMNSAGNVGIGTSGPSFKLDVAG